MKRLSRFAAGLLLMLTMAVGMGWFGLRLKADPFPPLADKPNPERRPIPDDLPDPVRAFAAAIYPDGVPVVESAVVQGRGPLAPAGFPMPTRFRFSYDTVNPAYYHLIEVTWFKQKILTVNERLLDGAAVMDLGPMGRVEDIMQVNQAAIQGYWAEMLAWVPAVVLTDERVQWEAVDDTHARLVIPELDTTEAFLVTFDAATHRMTEIETMRYAGESDTTRTRWRNRVLEWGTVDGWMVPVAAETQWADQTPWATWYIEDIALNVDVQERLMRFGA